MNRQEPYASGAVSGAEVRKEDVAPGGAKAARDRVAEVLRHG